MFILLSKIKKIDWRAFLIIALLGTFGPTGYWLNAVNTEQAKHSEIINYICKVIEPRLQAGAFREVQDYLISSSKMLGANVTPNIVLQEGDRVYELAPLQNKEVDSFKCNIAGRTDVSIDFKFVRLKLTPIQIILIYLLTCSILVTLWFLLSYLITLKSHELARQRTNEAIARIAKQVAHDIRSPLSALNVAVRNIADEQPQQAELIKRVAQRIDGIATELIALAKKDPLSRGRKNCELPNDLEQIVREKKIELTSDPRATLVFENYLTKGTHINVDTLDLARAVSNLINNSIEATRDNVKVVLRVEIIKNEIHISVIDDGPGFSGSNANKSNDRKKAGLGLGLTHAQSTVAAANGRLVIDKSIRNGAKVTLVFPNIDSHAK